MITSSSSCPSSRGPRRPVPPDVDPLFAPIFFLSDTTRCSVTICVTLSRAAIWGRYLRMSSETEDRTTRSTRRFADSGSPPSSASGRWSPNDTAGIRLPGTSPCSVSAAQHLDGAVGRELPVRLVVATGRQRVRVALDLDLVGEAREHPARGVDHLERGRRQLGAGRCEEHVVGHHPDDQAVLGDPERHPVGELLARQQPGHLVGDRGQPLVLGHREVVVLLLVGEVGVRRGPLRLGLPSTTDGREVGADLVGVQAAQHARAAAHHRGRLVAEPDREGLAQLVELDQRRPCSSRTAR